MAQIDTVKTWLPGDSVDAAGMNAIIDQASALEGLISIQATETPLLDTSEVIVRTATGLLKKRKVSTLQTGVTSVGLIANPSQVFGVTGTPVTGSGTITLSMDQQEEDATTNQNKVLASPANGNLGNPGFRALVPKDIAFFTDIPAHIVDCTVGNVFRKILHPATGTETLHLVDGIAGQQIVIYVIQGDVGGNRFCEWATDDSGGVIRWPSATGHHTMTRGLIGVTDIVRFLCMGSGLYYGTFDKDFVERPY